MDDNNYREQLAEEIKTLSEKNLDRMLKYVIALKDDDEEALYECCCDIFNEYGVKNARESEAMRKYVERYMTEKVGGDNGFTPYMINNVRKGIPLNDCILASDLYDFVFKEGERCFALGLLYKLGMVQGQRMERERRRK